MDKTKIRQYIEMLRDKMDFSPCDCDWCQALEAGTEALEQLEKKEKDGCRLNMSCVHCIHFSPNVSPNEISVFCNPSEKKYCSNYEARDE
jgi:hypothetical protein